MQSAHPIGDSTDGPSRGSNIKPIEGAEVAHSVILRQDEAFDDSPHPCLRSMESA